MLTSASAIDVFEHPGVARVTCRGTHVWPIFGPLLIPKWGISRGFGAKWSLNTSKQAQNEKNHTFSAYRQDLRIPPRVSEIPRIRPPRPDFDPNWGSVTSDQGGMGTQTFLRSTLDAHRGFLPLIEVTHIFYRALPSGSTLVT